MKFLIPIFIFLLPLFAHSQIEVILGNDTAFYKNLREYEDHNTIKDGYWKEYFTEGKLKEEGQYVNDNKHGRWLSYYINGNKKQIMFYENGLAHGRVRMYYENGNVSEEGEWNGKEKFWVGEYKYYYENGNPSYLWNYDETGKRTGVQRYFHENGNLSIEGEWKDGAEAGVMKKYYENGTLKSEARFVGGKLDVGTIKTYEKKEVEAAEGLGRFTGNGFYKSTNTNGQVAYEGIWKDGKFMDGSRYIYDGTDKLIKIYIYKDGTKIGEKDPE